MPPAPGTSYRFALRPWWIASHVFVVVCILGMVRAGFWQLSRLHERRDLNARIEARQALPEAPVGDVVPSGASPDQVSAAIHRRVTVSGTYRTADQVLVRNRSQQGSAGYWVVTPAVTDDGYAVAVNRGWIPVNLADGSPDAYAPPAGPVNVTGVVRESEVQSGIGIKDPDSGHLATLSRVDLDRYRQQLPYEIAPAWVQLEDQKPADPGPMPVPVEAPVLDDGPHLNYAGQWFIYATLTAIVYPLFLRRTARQKASTAETPLPDAAAGPGAGQGAAGRTAEHEGGGSANPQQPMIGSDVESVQPTKTPGA